MIRNCISHKAQKTRNSKQTPKYNSNFCHHQKGGDC